MTCPSQDPQIHNVTGAVIFTAYVISALSLTIIISCSLFTSYRRLLSFEKVAANNNLGKRLQIFSALAVLSFSTLSYHMLNYLIVSYRNWANQNDVPLPQRLLGSADHRVDLQIWPWLTASTLFQDFAEAIVGSSARFWWTQQALLVTMAWSVFMSFEGRKRKVPYLWAYAFISQILPISFAMNLFFLAMLLRPVSNPNEQIWTPTPVLQLLPLMAYYLFVLTAPFSAGTYVFIGVVFIIRLLLFCPIILPEIVPQGGGKSYLTPRKSSWIDAGPFYFVGVCSFILWLVQSLRAFGDNGVRVDKVFMAINDSPAVSALGYDYIMSLISLGVWLFIVGGDIA